MRWVKLLLTLFIILAVSVSGCVNPPSEQENTGVYNYTLTKVTYKQVEDSPSIKALSLRQKSWLLTTTIEVNLAFDVPKDTVITITANDLDNNNHILIHEVSGGKIISKGEWEGVTKYKVVNEKVSGYEWVKVKPDQADHITLKIVLKNVDDELHVTSLKKYTHPGSFKILTIRIESKEDVLGVYNIYVEYS